MAYCHNVNQFSPVVYMINHPVIARANSPKIVQPAQLFASSGAGILSEGLDEREDSIH